MYRRRSIGVGARAGVRMARTAKSYARSAAIIAQAMAEATRLIRDCKHIERRIREAAASDDFDQDTRELRCATCGKLVEDLS